MNKDKGGGATLTLLLWRSTDELETGEVWNHDMKNAADDPTIVTEDYVRENMKNEGFVRYVYNSARLMSDTTTISNEKIKRDPSNIQPRARK